MNKLCLSLGLVVSALLAGCGGQNHAPPAPASFSGSLPTLPEPATEVNALNGQLWTSTNASGPQRRVVVRDGLGFLGWWVEQPDSGPPVYGVFSGDLQPQAGTDRFDTTDMVGLQLSPYQVVLGGNFAMTSPHAGDTQVAFQSPTATETMRADALAHQSLSMDQRSGRYAGELQLSDRREPVSLQWNSDGSFSLSMTHRLPNECGATGQTSPLAGAPARLLAFTLSFSGTNCPVVRASNLPGDPNPSVISLSGISMSGAIDAGSADAFVLFGRHDDHRIPIVLPATRVPPPSLLGAWTGINANAQEFHLAVIEVGTPRKRIEGWTRSLATTPPTYGVLMGSTAALDEGASAFSQNHLFHLSTADASMPSVTFSGALPASELMNVQFASAAATMQASPIVQLALPTPHRVGRYTGDLHMPGLREPAVLDWSADGQLSLVLSGWSDCGATGTTIGLAGAVPTRWTRFRLDFQGSQCPTSSTGVGLSGQIVFGSIDASSGDAFVLFGSNAAPAFQLPVVMPATRQP